MSFNRGDVRADVRRRLEEFATSVITDSDINQEFNYTLRDLERQIDFRNLMTSDLTSLVTVENQQEYTLPSINGEIRKIIDLVIENVHYSEIDFLERDNVKLGNSVALSDVTMGNNVYYLYGVDTIGFIPIPDTDGENILIYYYRFHPDVTDDSTDLLLPDIVREAMVTRILAGVMVADETIPDATIDYQKAEYQVLLNKAREHLQQTSRSKISQFKYY